jgi:hypothetical protein
MTLEEAVAFVREHGVVLASAKGTVPRLTEAIVDEPIKGSWWAQPKSYQIFALLQAVTESEDILVCRLADGKVTLVHRRLWPALVRVAERFPPDQTGQRHVIKPLRQVGVDREQTVGLLRSRHSTDHVSWWLR